MNPRTWSFETAVRTLWMEARGEPDEGRKAVAHVIWNRLHSWRYGRTLAAVCLAPLQFSCWNTSDPNRRDIALLADSDPTLDALRVIFANAQGEPDPTGGATHYYARTIAPPSWAADMTFCGRFGNQNFYR